MSLWGDEFAITPTAEVAKKIINKIDKPKKVSSSKTTKKSAQIMSSLDLKYQLHSIQTEVYRILGKFKDDTVVIRNIEEYKDYIQAAIKNGVIAVDTETNNSLDPISCKIMGLCIYTPGLKQAYVPVNHVDSNNVRFTDQLTEAEIAEELRKLSSTKIIMHNGKFDYQVIKCTCGVELDVYWDTMIAVRILDENEKRAGLKEQYIDKINPEQEKYSIDHLFKDIPYEVVDPEIFALYAATDSKITYELYLWQLDQFNKPENKSLWTVMMHVEMPVVQVAAEMELTGVGIDVEYAKRLSLKYHLKLDELDQKIDKELHNYDDIIEKWRQTPEANIHPKSKKVNKYGEFTDQKSKNEQLETPVSLTSPTQLAIFLYDVLQTPVIDKKNPRGTGEEILNKIDNPLCKLILDKRGLEKLIGTYIDKLPKCISDTDNRLHAKFNQNGAGTGRFSSSEPNLQNIPSHNKEIRLMFSAGYRETVVEKTDDYYIFSVFDEVETSLGWVKASELKVGDMLVTDGSQETISNVLLNEKEITVYC